MTALLFPRRLYRGAPDHTAEEQTVQTEMEWRIAHEHGWRLRRTLPVGDESTNSRDHLPPHPAAERLGLESESAPVVEPAGAPGSAAGPPLAVDPGTYPPAEAPPGPPTRSHRRRR